MRALSQCVDVGRGATVLLDTVTPCAREYTFRGAVTIETGSDSLDWLNKGIFVSVGGRQRGGVIYEVYLVG